MFIETKHRLGRSVALTAMVCALACAAGTPTLARKAAAIDSSKWRSEEYMVPMRDGVKLSTIAWFPQGEGPWPVVLVRTPYGSRGVLGWESERLLQNGYALVGQDSRGRFESEGVGLALAGDAPDGYDCVEWLAKQPWCNGKIGTWGISGPGMTQYAMATTGPPHLSAQHIGLASCEPYGAAVFQGGALAVETALWWLKNNGFDMELHRKWLEAHPTYDHVWKALDLRASAPKVNWPILHWSGWYDCFAQGTIDGFVLAQHKGGPKARGRQLLIMGPWPHGIAKQFSLANLPQNALLPPFMDLVHWFDYCLKGQHNDLAGAKPVYYYTIGDVLNPDSPQNAWHAVNDWPVPAENVSFYLQPDGGLARAKPKTPASFSYLFDPKNPVRTLGGNNLHLEKGPIDQSENQKRKDVVCFTSEPLKEPMEVTGRVRVKLWAASRAKDTDFTAMLCDVLPDGRSLNVLDGIIRARYRNGFTKQELMKPGTAYQFDIDLWSTSWVFQPGHRIRVAISSSNHPRFDVNPNTGEKWRLAWSEPEKLSKTVVAKNTIFCGGRRASRIILPVVATKPDR